MSNSPYLLNVDKPTDWTSRDIVNRAMRFAGTRKIGHAGTLDPFATGVLVLAVGRATRLVEYIQRMPKAYHATVQFGACSSTDDLQGEISPVPVEKEPTIAEIKTAVSKFIGTIQQRPPKFSAIKVYGE